MYLKQSGNAYRLFVEGQFHEAQKLYEKSLNVKDFSIADYYYLGICLLLQGMVEEAHLIWLSSLLDSDNSEFKNYTETLISTLDQEANRFQNLNQISNANILRKQIHTLDPFNLNNLLSRIKLPDFPTSVHFNIEHPEKHLELLKIPSETTLSERQLLFNFFAHIWPGYGNVLEIGPFLGGTSRSIAFGMLNNPKLNPHARLYTYDKFQGYYKIDALHTYLDPLLKSGVLQESDLLALGGDGNFLKIFQKLHQDQPYSSLLITNEGRLPTSPDDSPEQIFSLPADIQFTSIFVDGCKSWYATKYFMKTVCTHSQPGTYYIFQDYGWYTCFWISSFLQIFSDFFHLISYVDDTYVFQLTEALHPSNIDALFPDDPRLLNEDSLENIFSNLLNSAAIRKDMHASVSHHLHYAGFMAYVGNLKTAKAHIERLMQHDWPKSYQDRIIKAYRSPTYLPNGQAILLTDSS